MRKTSSKSLKKKIVNIVIVSSIAAVLAPIISLFTYSYFIRNKILLRDLAGFAGVISSNGAPYVAHKDYEGAGKILASLAAKPSIFLACVYDLDGKVVAIYQRDRNEAIAPPPLSELETAAYVDYVETTVPIAFEGQRVGFLTLRQDKSEYRQVSARHLFIFGISLLVAFIVAFLMGTRLQGTVLGPILSLARTAKEVTDKRDYSLRAEKGPPDEVGQLIDNFNEMLDLIEARDEALRESSEMFTKTFHSSPSVMLLTDMATGIHVDVNSSYLMTSGYSREEVVGGNYKNPPFFKYRSDLNAMKKALRDIGSFINVESEIITKSGMVRTLLLSAETIEVGGRTFALVVGDDVTDKKLMEERFMHGQKMEAIGKLAGGVAHDFNNQLTVILGILSVLDRKLGKDDDMRRYHQEMRAAAERSAALTRQLLAFSRRQMIEPVPLCPNDVLADLETMLRRLIGEDVELETDLEENVGHVMMDPSQFEQVIVNLVVNARDAMPEGGKLVLQTRSATIRSGDPGAPHDLKSGKFVIVSVRDNGTGILPEVMERIFEPFFTTKEEGKGTGLGLASVYGIVRQHDGHITADSKEGIGTTFSIFLKRLSEHEITASALRAKEGPVAPGGWETVLVVEDEESVRRVAKDILELEGYEVLTASSGEEGLMVFEEKMNDIDMVLTDVVMTGMNGWEMVKQIRLIHPDMKTLFMSGYNEELVAKGGEASRTFRFIQKPFTNKSLLGKVREVLDG